MNLGTYRLVGEISRGGMGIVFKALAPDGSAVAIKLLRSPRPDALARFDRERRLMESLGAAGGFVPVLDAGMAPHGAFLVMPLVEGGTLRDRLRHGPLSSEETLSLGRFLATTIAAAHERSIVHRDLKPENVLFTRDGRPLVADLGVAKHFDGDAPGASRSVSLSRSGALLGTAGYMPREQMRDAKTAGPEADVFAIGAILYECLSGRPAFVGESVLALITLVENGTCPSLARERPEVPRWLVAVIERAMNREPEKRFADARQLAEALHEPATGDAKPLRLAPVLLLVAVALAGASVLVFRRQAPTTSQRASVTEPVATIVTSAAPLTRKPLRAYIGSTDPALAINPMLEIQLVLDANRAPTTERGRALLESACRQADAGDLGGAIATCSELVRLEPRNAAGWFKRGVFRGIAAKLDEAEADLTRAIELAPDDARAIGNRGQVRLGGGDLAGARADLDRSLLLDREQVTFLISRGEIRVRAEEFEAAAKDIDRATELDPTSGRAWVMRATVDLCARDFVAVERHATRAIEARPDLGIAWALRAQALLGQGQAQRALVDGTRAVAVDPGDEEAWGILASIHVRLGRTEDALADLTRAIEVAKKDPLRWLHRAVLRNVLQDRDGAIADCTHSIELDPGNAQAWAERAEAHRWKGELGAAIEDASRAVELAPSSADGWTARGLALSARGDPERALQDLDRAISLKPSYQALTGRCELRNHRGDTSGALRDADAAVALQPEDLPAYVLRGRLREETGETTGALVDYERFLSHVKPGTQESSVALVRSAIATLRGRGASAPPR